MCEYYEHNSLVWSAHWIGEKQLNKWVLYTDNESWAERVVIGIFILGERYGCIRFIECKQLHSSK